MFSVSNLSLKLGSRTLFDAASFSLNLGVRYGLVGANGTGKSTFLKILSGEITPTSGTFSKPKQESVGVLRQDYYHFEKDAILDVVLMGKELLWKTFKEKDRLLSKEELSNEDIETLGDLEERIEQMKGYEAESEAAALLEGLGILKARHTMPLASLSGGYKIRVLLAQLLFKAPSLLLLDEPTNYLDIISIRWLEQYLKNFPGCLVVCSHDRSFLNGISQEILDIDYETITLYRGTYEDFVEQKIQKTLQLGSESESLEKKKKHLESFVERFGAKATKARQAQSRMKMISKIEQEQTQYSQKPSSRRYPNFTFFAPERSSQVILEIQNLSKAFGSQLVLNSVGFQIERGDKIAIVGPNGVGKSTLLEMMMGYLKPDQGEFKWGSSLKIGYFPQHFERELKDFATPVEYLSSKHPLETEQALRSTLGKVLFSKEDILKKLASLSGGEKARLVLASLMLAKPNFIICDEPTNHLDLESCESLEEALQDFEGTVLCVSHNRHFVSQIASRIIEIKHESFFDFKGSYEEYQEKRGVDFLTYQKAEKVQTQSKKPPIDCLKINQDFSRKQIQELEKQCQDSEVVLDAMNKECAQPDFYLIHNEDEVKSFFKKKEQLEVFILLIYEKLEEFYKK
jgi:ATPase subunit of ABC transporter with duplicated ATPase domains